MPVPASLPVCCLSTALQFTPACHFLPDTLPSLSPAVNQFLPSVPFAYLTGFPPVPAILQVKLPCFLYIFASSCCPSQTALEGTSCLREEKQGYYSRKNISAVCLSNISPVKVKSPSSNTPTPSFSCQFLLPACLKSAFTEL